jgi:DNA-binding response OmpR family regulator
LRRASRPLRICLAEDDLALAERIAEFLLDRNIDLRICTIAQDIGLAVRAAEADILLVDSDFAGGDGARLARSLRADRAISCRPIIQFISRGAAATGKGVNTGADVYLRKPFPLGELLHAIESVAAVPPERPASLHYADISLDPIAMLVIRAGKRIALGAYEFRLLRALMQAPEQVVPSRHVIDAVWHYDEAVTRKMMGTTVNRLRVALNEQGGTNLVRLIPLRGVLLATGSSAHCVVGPAEPVARTLGRGKDIDGRRAESRRVVRA